MHIEEELLNFLHSSMRENDTKYRDIQLILFFFGFRGEPWPTLEDAAIKFNVGESENRRSERPRQIIKDKFTSKVSLSDLPQVREVVSILENTEYSTIEEIIVQLKQSSLVPESFSMKGILNLIQQLGVCKDHNIYTNKLLPASRISLESETNLYLLKSSEVHGIKLALKKLLTYPGLVGISSLRTFFETHEDILTYRDILLDVIRSRDDIWLSIIDGEHCYIVEEKDNTLINNLEKIKNITDAVNVETLTIVLSNAFKQRTPPKGNRYPTEKVLRKYLESSRFTEFDGNVVKLKLSATVLRGIERDVVSYMQGKGTIGFIEIKNFLEKKGYSKPNIDKAILNSVLIFANKSVRKSYTYTLLKNEAFANDAIHDRYMQYKEKLLIVCAEGTDIEGQSFVRKEQQILRQWLFEDKNYENCAICCNKFSVDSLVAAHKKPRSECSFNERVDPYVVMPLCKFGCDYLYEIRQIEINDGVINQNMSKGRTEFEKTYIEKIKGNIMDERWVKGDPDYFRQ
jgi:hypothetical protein